MNIVLIMSGGVGNRFGSIIPKQYNLINGKPVIDYVIDAVEDSKKCDKIIIAMDKQYINFSEKIKKSRYDIVPNGENRFKTMKNGLDFVHDKYDCNKLVIVDAVAPFLYSDLIDEFFDLLDDNDAVITAQKITGGFTDYNLNKLNREDYVITQSPEGFNFDLLYNNFDVNSKFQETACMLPKGSQYYFYFEFKNNLKLTYDFDLRYAEYVLTNIGKSYKNSNIAFFDKSILYTTGLKSYLLRNQKVETEQWLNEVYISLPKLIDKWEISSFLPNQTSRFGLVLQAQSKKYGNVVIKYIPKFVGRYERELEAMKILSSTYMCELIDYEEDDRVMLLRSISPAKYASFEENLKLTEFFKKVFSNAVPYNINIPLKYIPDYFEELQGKLQNSDKLVYLKEEVVKELEYAIDLYKKVFIDEKKYIIHGDLHELNILNNGQEFWGIDPNGLLCPIEFDAVRFIRNDVRNHPEFGFKERFDILLHYFTRFVDKHKLVCAFIIDMAFCTYNSVFENETPEETLVDLELIAIAKEYLD